MMRRIPGWCALLGWVVIPASAACLVKYAYECPLWKFDAYLAAAGLLFLSRTAVGIRSWRLRRAGRGSTVSAALCLASLLAVASTATLGFRTTVGYDTRSSVGIGSFAGPGKVAFAASSPPEISDGLVPMFVQREWLVSFRQACGITSGGSMGTPMRRARS